MKKIVFLFALAAIMLSAFQVKKRMKLAPIPAAIQKLISRFKAEEVQNPPRSVYSYTYHSKTVYYVPAICCDFFSDLYDNKGLIIGHPDGGFTGKGDGKTADFSETRTNGKLIWKDNRGKQATP